MSAGEQAASKLELPRVRHLEPQTTLAADVIVTDDPRAALVLAQGLCSRPRMFNHARGLWGYVGTTAGGRPLAVQSAGIGSASVATVCCELVALGAQRLVGIWGCAGLDHQTPGQLVTVARLVAPDPVSSTLLDGYEPRPDARLLEHLADAGATPVPCATSPLPYEPTVANRGRWLELGASVVDLGAAALLAVASWTRVPAAALLFVDAVPADGAAELLSASERERALEAAGQAALAALAA